MDTQRILAELRSQQSRLDQVIAVIESLETGRPTKSAKATAGAAKSNKRHISPAGRKRIAAAARKRWAAHRKGIQPAAKKAGTRKMSPEARKRIGEAMRKRWAERKRSLKKAA